MALPQPHTTARDPAPEWLEAWDLVDQIERKLKAMRHTRAQGVAIDATQFLRDALSDLRDEED